MSVIFAIKQGDTVYMGADTQTTISRNGSHTGKEFFTDAQNHYEGNYKIIKLSNGVLIGYTGEAFFGQRMLVHSEWFDDVPKEGLSKRYIVEKVLPKLFETFKNEGLIDLDSGEIEMDLSMLIAYKDKLIRFDRNFDIVDVDRYGVVGSGQIFGLPSMIDTKFDARSAIIEALRISAGYDLYVDAPFTLIDTKLLEFEIAEG